MLRIFRTKGKRTQTIWWVLILITVVTFLGGFVFILGSGLDSTNRARASGAIGTVDGMPISQTEYQNAIADQRAGFKQRYGNDPGERDLKMLEVRAWRQLTLQRLVARQARSLGIRATDHEVVVSLKSSPPSEILASPAFQTDGKFDAAKYQAFMTDPSRVQDVARIEDETRRQLPVRKFEERLMSSVKWVEPELMETYRNRFERVSATILQVPPVTDAKLPPPTEADLDRMFLKHKDRFTAGERTQLEVLLVPKKFGDEEVRPARDLAQSLAQRARRGEDFASLARDYSEGPGAEKGGVVDQAFELSEFGTALAPKIAALDTGQVSDALQDGGRFLVIKVLERALTPQGRPGLKVAQIVIKVRPNPTQLKEQYDALVKLAGQAAKMGLGKVAAAQGMATSMTQPFDANSTPPELFGAPEAADWGVNAKRGEVSPVYGGIDYFAVVQVAAQTPAGPAPRAEVSPQLRQLAELDARVERAKPQVDAIAAALSQGRSLEQAAATAGLTVTRIDGMTRLQPDPRLGGALDVVGALFAAHPGQVVGPVRAVNGWYFARLEEHLPADPAMLPQVKEQLSNELLQRRQQNLLANYFTQLRSRAKVKDLRSELGY